MPTVAFITIHYELSFKVEIQMKISKKLIETNCISFNLQIGYVLE